MLVRFLQSCDKEFYTGLLQASSRSVLAYCRRFDCDYDVFVGLKRGAKPWHAALNRITILHDYLQLGYRGWVVYLDVDAYIADLSFDVRSFLADKQQFALIAAPSGIQPPKWWDINNGVFALNLDHPIGQAIVRGWKAKLDAVSDEDLAGEQAWSQVIDDQAVMHQAMLEIDGCERAVHIDHEILNWDSRFIRQHVRKTGSLWHREERVRQLVDAVVGGAGNDDDAGNRALVRQMYRDFSYGLYHAALLREPDGGGLDAAVDWLASGNRSHLQEMQACFHSDEFASKASSFLRTYLTPEALAATMRELVEGRA